MNSRILSIVYLCAIGSVFAQPTAGGDSKKPGDTAYDRRVAWFDKTEKGIEELFKGFTIAKSVEDKNAAVEPASIGGVRSDKNGTSTAIDAGISWEQWHQREFSEEDIKAGNKIYWAISPKIEYHRNDVGGDKEQDSLQAGFGVSWRKLIAPTTGGKDPLNLHYDSSLKYKNDRVKNGQGFSGSVSVTPTKAAIFLGAVDETESELFAFGWFPILAFQTEQADNLKNGPSGSVSRIKAGLDVKILPLNPLNFEIGTGFNVWFNIDRSGPFKQYDDTQTLFKAYAIYWLTDEKNVGIGVDYSNGENPETNLPDDQFTSFGIKIRF